MKRILLVTFLLCAVPTAYGQGGDSFGSFSIDRTSKSVDVRDAVYEIGQDLATAWGVTRCAERSTPTEIEECRVWMKFLDVVERDYQVAILDPALRNRENDYDQGGFWAQQQAAQRAVDAVKDARLNLLPKVESAKAKNAIDVTLADIDFTFRNHRTFQGALR